MVFQHVLLSCIIKKNKHVKFEMDVKDTQCMDKGTWYSTTICKNNNGQSFKHYFKRERKDRYYLMFSVDAYDKDRVSRPDDAISGGGVKEVNCWCS